MGSPLRLTVAGAAVAAIDELWASVTADVESTEAALSRFRAESDLSRLNVAAGSGAWLPVSDRLRHCLAISHRAGRVTAGRFDPRVIVRLEGLGERGGVDLPLAPAGSRADRWLELDARHRRARLSVPVDSGGIGKGLALRWAAAVLARRRVDRFLLEAGGDIVVHGDAPDEGGWRIGVEDPHRSAGPVAVIALRRGAVVTSSTMVRRWTAPDGAEVHHLIDPATGEPAEAGSRGHRRRARPGLGRGVVEGALPRRASRDRAGGTQAWNRRVVGRIGRCQRDDAGRAGHDELGAHRRRPLTVGADGPTPTIAGPGRDRPTRRARAPRRPPASHATAYPPLIAWCAGAPRRAGYHRSRMQLHLVDATFELFRAHFSRPAERGRTGGRSTRCGA